MFGILNLQSKHAASNLPLDIVNSSDRPIATHNIKYNWMDVRAQLMHYAFYELFDVIPADTPELLETAHRVRYQVFCVENKDYEDPAEHPDGLERDRYDAHSSHALVMHRQSGKAVGTVRVILPDENNLMDCFPLQRLCDHSLLQDPDHIRNSFEISRMCITREFQVDMINSCKNKVSSYLKHDKKYNQGAYHKFMMLGGRHMAAMGLVHGMFAQALKHDRIDGFGIMEPRYIKRLQNIGFIMEPLGPTIDYHGKRVPFRFNIKNVLENAMQHHYAVWNIVTRKGQLHRHLIDVEQRACHHMKGHRPTLVAV